MDTLKITNEEEALAAVKEDREALQTVPERLRTAELCLVAVKDRGGTLHSMPEGQRGEVLDRCKGRE